MHFNNFRFNQYSKPRFHFLYNIMTQKTDFVTQKLQLFFSIEALYLNFFDYALGN